MTDDIGTAKSHLNPNATATAVTSPISGTLNVTSTVSVAPVVSTIAAAASMARYVVKEDVVSFADKVKAAAIKYGIPAAALAVGFAAGKFL